MSTTISYVGLNVRTSVPEVEDPSTVYCDVILYGDPSVEGVAEGRYDLRTVEGDPWAEGGVEILNESTLSHPTALDDGKVRAAASFPMSDFVAPGHVASEFALYVDDTYRASIPVYHESITDDAGHHATEDGVFTGENWPPWTSDVAMDSVDVIDCRALVRRWNERADRGGMFPNEHSPEYIRECADDLVAVVGANITDGAVPVGPLRDLTSEWKERQHTVESDAELSFAERIYGGAAIIDCREELTELFPE